MRYLKTYLMALVLFALISNDVVSGHALPATIPGPDDPKAKAVLDSICKHYGALESMKVNMVLTRNFRNSIHIDTVRGFMEGEKYRLEMPHQDVVHDGKKVWFYDKALNKVFNKTANPQETNFLYPSRTLKKWETQFDYSIIGELNMGEHTFLKMEFKEKKSTGFGAKPPQQINMFIDKRNFNILKITVLQPNGDFLMLDYHDQMLNVKLDPAVFTMDMS